MLNCPFCEVLNRTGLSDLSGYICEGDWAYARENKDKWLFERKFQIGTGDTICDHTYKRIKHDSCISCQNTSHPQVDQLSRGPKKE
jgi:hypothetical protein